MPRIRARVSAASLGIISYAALMTILPVILPQIRAVVSTVLSMPVILPRIRALVSAAEVRYLSYDTEIIQIGSVFNEISADLSILLICSYLTHISADLHDLRLV